MAANLPSGCRTIFTLGGPSGSHRLRAVMELIVPASSTLRRLRLIHDPALALVHPFEAGGVCEEPRTGRGLVLPAYYSMHPRPLHLAAAEHALVPVPGEPVSCLVAAQALRSSFPHHALVRGTVKVETILPVLWGAAGIRTHVAVIGERAFECKE